MKIFIMKNTFFILFYGLIIFSLSACEKDDLSVKSPETDENVLVAKKLQILGFGTDDLKVRGDTLIVEGDILMLKSKLLDSTITKTSSKQATTSNFPFIRNSDMNLRIYIQPINSSAIPTGFTAGEIETIKSGLDMFLRSNLNSGGFNSITYTTNATDPYSIRVIQSNMGENVCGNAEFPTTVYENGMAFQKMSGNLNINISLFRFQLNDSQKKFLIAHEFGHMMGFRHTNWRTDEPQSSNNIGAYTVPLTNNTSVNPDPNSVFNSRTCGYSWNGFSTDDLQAIKYVTRGTTSSK